MNFITYAHAISLFPRATFVDQVTCQTVSSSPFDHEQWQKYVVRGWRGIQDGIALLWPEFQWDCRVGDRYTWVLPLQFEEPPPKNPCTDFLFINGWRINTQPQCSCLFEWHLLFHVHLRHILAYSGGWYVRRVIEKYFEEGPLYVSTWYLHYPFWFVWTGMVSRWSKLWWSPSLSGIGTSQFIIDTILFDVVSIFREVAAMTHHLWETMPHRIIVKLIYVIFNWLL